MSTPEQRAQNREASLEQSFAALQEAWVLLNDAVDDLPDGETRDAALRWLRQHLLWGTPETVEECVEWLREHNLPPA